MGLNAALKDRARRVYSEPTGVGAGTAEVKGPWFKARVLDVPPKDLDPKLEGKAQMSLLCGTKATDGSTIVVKANERLEIESAVLGGRQVLSVMGPPDPIRKKVNVIGYEMGLGYAPRGERPSFT